MKLKIQTELPDGYTPSHGDLAEAAATMMAKALLPLFTENLPEDAARANVQGIVSELAYMFDAGSIELGGRSYRPRIAFADDSGALLPGVIEFAGFEDAAEDALDAETEAHVSFEVDEAEDA